MTTLHNEITINVPLERVWEILTNLEALDKYDPVVKRSVYTGSIRSGIGAKRKCDCADNKNWFEEKVTEWVPNKSLTFEITDCSIPMNKLSHRYTLSKAGDATLVKQEMIYEMKFGWFGKLLDALFVRSQTDKGIKRFFIGLKQFAENK